jgi:hypothetical protein
MIYEQLAVINTAGEVWTRDLDLPGGTIGVGSKLTGPGLFGGPDDQFVVACYNSIAVVTTSGAFWPRYVQIGSIGSGIQTSGSLFGGTDTKYVLYDCGCNAVYVVNTKGEVWSHPIGSQNGIPKSVGPGSKMKGLLFGSPNAKYVVLGGPGILVINTQGEVWAHFLSSSKPMTFCNYDTVGTGYKLSGPGLFGAPNDKYVAYQGGSLLVINSLGEVWAHTIGSSTVGPGRKLKGPGLFGGPNDKYVVTYQFPFPPPP